MSKPRPDRETLSDIERVAKHEVRLIEFFRDWEARELRELPFRKDDVAQGQGRCQILKELNDLFKLHEAPKNQAKS